MLSLTQNRQSMVKKNDMNDLSEKNSRKICYNTELAIKFLKNTFFKKYTIVFLGTRPDIAEITKIIAYKTNQNYIKNRWIPGLLTNWEQKKTHFHYYRNLNKYLKKNYLGKRGDMKTTLETKHVTLKTAFRMKRLWEGVLKATQRPMLLVVLDGGNQKGALREAHRAGVPTIALVESSVDTRLITYPIVCSNLNMETVLLYSELFASVLATKID